MNSKYTPTTFFWFILATLAFGQVCRAQIFPFALDFPINYLPAHNAARAAVGVGNIKWDTTLAIYAQIHANRRVDDCANILSHGPYGENIAIGNSPSFTGKYAVELWVSDKANYNYTSNTCETGTICSPYTQVVWRDSVNVGCARASCINGHVFVICSYSPPGNLPGQKPF